MPLRQFGAVGDLLLVPERPGQVVVQFGGEFIEATKKGLVAGELVQTFRADLPQQRHRITSDLLPELRIDCREQVLGGLVPRPPQVDRQPFERGQSIGEMRADGEPARGLSRDSTLLSFRRSAGSVPVPLHLRLIGQRTTVGIAREEAIDGLRRRSVKEWWEVVGRIGIDDVTPVVSGGQFPAKAVVGEIVPVRATVWREGHDAVAATLVVRYHGSAYPQLVDGPAGSAASAPVPVPIETVVNPPTRIKPAASAHGAGHNARCVPRSVHPRQRRTLDVPGGRVGRSDRDLA